MAQEDQLPHKSTARRLVACVFVFVFLLLVSGGVGAYVLAREAVTEIATPLASSVRQAFEKVIPNSEPTTPFDPQVLEALRIELSPKVKEPPSQAPAADSDPIGIVKYVDQNGSVHYVDNISKVPEQFRGKAVNADNLPRINKLDIAVGAKGQGDSVISKMLTKSSSANKKGPKRVQLFVTSWCSFCQQMESFLRKQGIQFTKYDIEKSSEGAAIHAKIGGGGVPVTRIGEEVIRGYAPDEVLAALGKFKS